MQSINSSNNLLKIISKNLIPKSYTLSSTQFILSNLSNYKNNFRNNQNSIIRNYQNSNQIRNNYITNNQNGVLSKLNALNSNINYNKSFQHLVKQIQQQNRFLSNNSNSNNNNQQNPTHSDNDSSKSLNNNNSSNKNEMKIKPEKFLIGFTCKKCNTRSYKLISKKSYYKGVVIIRCDKCKNLHLIADHLGWFDSIHKFGTIEDYIKRNKDNKEVAKTLSIKKTIEELSKDEKRDVLEFLMEEQKEIKKN